MAHGESMVVLTASDNFTFDAFVVPAAGTSKGGLVIVQEIFGLTDQLKSVARSYAADGYDAIVPALFDRVSPKTVVPFDNPDGGRALMSQLDADKVMLDIEAARKHVDHGRGVSLLGFCWGGGQVLRAAGILDLTAVVSYYGTKLTAYLDPRPKCPTLFHFGETDTFNYTPEIFETVKKAIPEAEMYVYAAGHAFANDARKTHVPDAATVARQRSLAFLDRHHKAA